MPIAIYLTEREIDGKKYAEQVCARSWSEAEEIAAKSGAKVLGTLESSVCARCGLESDIAKTYDKAPPLGEDEWPDEITR